MSNEKQTNPSPSEPDPEMLKYLDLLLNYDLVENEKEWDVSEKMDEISGDDNEEGAQ